MFQDISESVLKSYMYNEKIVLSVVDKQKFFIREIYICNPEAIVTLWNTKLVRL